MKIIHYIPTIDESSGGIGSYMQLIAKELGKLTELHIITHKSKNMLIIENAKLHFIDNNLMHLYSIKQQFIDILNTISPDLLHINCCWYPLCALTQKWAQKLGYKIILSPHGMLEPWVLQKNHWTKKMPALFLYQKRAIKNADMLVATAPTEQQNIYKLGLNNKITIIPNGIQIDKISCKETWEKSKTILFLALLRPNKGAHLLIEAIALIKSSLQDWKVIIAGKGDNNYTSYLNQLILKYNLESIISLPGAIYGDSKWELYKKADIFVLPTLNENFGIVIAESLLCGTPVITCKGAPWKELIDKKCGWWIERTPQDIADTIYQAINLEDKELKAMGTRGREYIINNFAANNIAYKMSEMYKNLK